MKYIAKCIGVGRAAAKAGQNSQGKFPKNFMSEVFIIQAILAMLWTSFFLIRSQILSALATGWFAYWLFLTVERANVTSKNFKNELRSLPDWLQYFYRLRLESEHLL